MPKILIIDEKGFSRICSAILEFEGHRVETISNIDNLASSLSNKEFRLIITSYYNSVFSLEEVKNVNIPIIILTDLISGDLLNMLKSFDNCYCMIKPLDYEKFRFLVNQIMSNDLNMQGGYNIV